MTANGSAVRTLLALPLTLQATLPEDHERATLVGRVWRPDVGGPSIVAVRGLQLVDVTSTFATIRDLVEADDPSAALAAADGPMIASLEAVLLNTPPDRRDVTAPWLLPPLDLQAVKAAGVTFAISMLERVIEERARGNPAAADAIRKEIESLIGSDLAKLRPGSPEAVRLKETLMAQGSWSQYLEVGIGPDAEIFTKCQPMASVGTGAEIGVNPMSSWNNPEPEIVLAVSSSGRIAGATLGNDVNLRDVEGRSALLLSKAKDNNASCAIGPFLRLFDADFTLDDVRRMRVDLTVEGSDGFRLDGMSSMTEISRDPADLVAAMVGPHHQYPDGAVLFLGTLFSPTKDRGAPGAGFTHHFGDLVTIASPRLGALINRVRRSDECPPWTFGVSHLLRNLAARGQL